MKYNSVLKAEFLYRKNRFISICKKGFKILTVYVPNTGRCKELLTKGVTVFVTYNDNPNRKTSYTLIAVIKGDKIINIDSQAPNEVVYEALLKNKIDLGFKPDFIKREFTHGDSRFDFYIEGENKKALMEVKGVTLEDDGIVAFPDAPTKRGLKHINGLINSRDNYLTYILFLIQIKDVKFFTPNYFTDINFSKSLLKAKECGVKILAYDSYVTRNLIEIGENVPVVLEETWNLDSQKK
ncbi:MULTISPECIES: DNA/RNA nuclease SfsA [Peptoniphilus]|jgi:sugar fermentation stimulation protein|uniref:DNA/RNA nuclease SfsA n=2 Tax=Peptoniphilaceae TaxID=1570339 RepID=UPI0008D9EBCC|nr:MULTISPECIES: DNA/RNA nuclease SfsA [Peptoniphilus]MBS6610182.1 DNA/RNA nuclease SfsA [Peptoniphilus harei]MDU1043326.1 DNA/RNA nuclease SfsA [Peptoniphilus rhinitidis]MDU1954042.1 DNA/RNA nuclease SfsA [Peptoniphilus lacydonensis]MDU2109539.1 DNA/RNA nuclease SfsA [Peptoniphilus lacydonensis]MDU2115281.1 DNA/RNA nuclease SfsA [Peptoniphilus lacydonensis]